MKFLIAGFGSIGRRHLRNLRALGHHDFVLYRSGKSILSDDEIADVPTEHEIENALGHKPAAALITNPTALHIPVALAAARAGCHLFLEKPLSHSFEGIDELHQEVRTRDLVAFVGFQFRFHPGLQQIKGLLEEQAVGTVVSVEAQWGEYLPDWHPWEDYRQSYSARPELGGGVILTLCHPLDYLRWLIGEVTDVSAEINGGLGLDVEDTADILLRFDTGAIGHVHLDYIQRPPVHWLHIVGQRGVIHWDNLDGIARLYRPESGEWESFPIWDKFERNIMFLSEMEQFLACLAGREQSLCTLEDGIQNVRIALAAKQAAQEKRRITL